MSQVTLQRPMRRTAEQGELVPVVQEIRRDTGHIPVLAASRSHGKTGRLTQSNDEFLGPIASLFLGGGSLIVMIGMVIIMVRALSW